VGMLWRVRASLPDRPGGLAVLAQQCAEAGVDIRGVQVFPGTDAVTDELVLESPDGWSDVEVEKVITGSGWTHLTTQPVTSDALTDQPTRYVAAARRILERPASFPEVVASLFDAQAEPVDAPEHDTMEMTVGDVAVQVHRVAPFTEVERARGTAMASLVDDVLVRSRESAVIGSTGGRLMGTGTDPEYVVSGHVVSAMVDDVLVGTASVGAAVEGEPDVRRVDLRVEPGWQRRGIGTRLLTQVSRLAHSHGASEILLISRADNQAVMPMVLGAGMRGRIRVTGDSLTVRVPLRHLDQRR